MDTNRYHFECECGKQFKLKTGNLGGELLCPACNKRLKIPESLIPTATISQPDNAERKSLIPKHDGVDLKKIAIGTLLLTGGVVLVVVFYYSWTQTGRIRLYLPISALALLVIGLGSMLKGLFGNAFEWD